MSEFETAVRKAYEISRGNAVKRPGATDEDTIFLKAERQGTDYIHHYLIQITPAPRKKLALIYVDPEEPLLDTGGIPGFSYTEEPTRTNPETGDIFTNTKGTYLKVAEDPKSQKMFAFVDIASGEIKRRQERNITAVYGTWRMAELLIRA